MLDLRCRLAPLAAACAVAILAAPSPAAAADPPDLDPTPDDLPGEIAVDLRDELSEPDVDAFVAASGAPFAPSSFVSARTHVLRGAVPAERAPELMRKLAADPRVEAVEPVARVRASFRPNDPLLAEQWHLDRVGAERAWSHCTGRGVTVAVVDTGIACEDHGPFTKGSDLGRTRCVAGFDFVAGSPHASDDHGHGTHVAGTVAQSTDNALGAAGLAFHARLMPVKVLDASGMGTTVAVADGIRFAADAGAHVINLSLGGTRASRLMRKAVAYARSKGVVVVAAAGNNGSFVEYPAAFESVIAVSATEPSDRLAHFSSRGPSIDIAAPGVQVVQQTVCNGGRDRCERYPGWSGTSMAAPHVAGAAALLMSCGVVSVPAVESALLGAARAVHGEPRGGPLYGAGVLDAGAAVAGASVRALLVRLALCAVLTALVVARIRARRGVARPWRPAFWLAALAFGPGLLFLAPLLASRVSLPVDLVSRPVPEWDLFVGVSVHRWLPLAHFFVPLGLSAVAFGVRRLRPIIAGVSIGTAAYLLSLAALGWVAPGATASALLWVWALANAAGCLWLARLSLDEGEGTR
jgi:serine protease